MTAAIAKNCEIFVDGFNLSCAFKELNVSKQAEEIDTTALCTTGNKTFKPGLKSGTLSLMGMYDYNAVDLDELGNVLDDAFSSQDDLVVSASLGTIAAGGAACMCRGGQTKADIESPLNQLVMTSTDIRAKGNVFTGVWLFKSSASSATVNGSSVDNGASTSNGGTLHAHVWLEADSTATNSAFLLQHSTDGSSWSTLISSTAIGGTAGVLAVEVAQGTTVNRYLRIQFTATGGKSYGSAAFYRA